MARHCLKNSGNTNSRTTVVDRKPQKYQTRCQWTQLMHLMVMVFVQSMFQSKTGEMRSLQATNKKQNKIVFHHILDMDKTRIPLKDINNNYRNVSSAPQCNSVNDKKTPSESNTYLMQGVIKMLNKQLTSISVNNYFVLKPV